VAEGAVVRDFGARRKEVVDAGMRRHDEEGGLI